jgi:hypothetical protein
MALSWQHAIAQAQSAVLQSPTFLAKGKNIIFFLSFIVREEHDLEIVYSTMNRRIQALSKFLSNLMQC